MPQSRLSVALDDGLIDLPAQGAISVIRPAPGFDLSALPRDRVRIVQTYRPAFDAWAQGGWDVAPEIASAALAVVCLPRSKALARGLIAASGAPVVVVDGQKTDGADALWREARGVMGTDLPVVTRGHGRLFVLRPGAALADWVLPGPVAGPDGLFSQAGVFSEAGPDDGSALLAAALPARLPARIADYGAGNGYLAQAALAREGVVSIDLIEAEKLALDCARLGISDSRAQFLWADATRHDPRAPYDGIVMNPPFHNGRAAEPDLGRAFIAAARRALSPMGQLWLVANRHLPYEAELRAGFRDLAEIGGNSAYKIYHAGRPKR
jgi:16S rRNA (guanine1207-N2)-methyltransferase